MLTIVVAGSTKKGKPHFSWGGVPYFEAHPFSAGLFEERNTARFTEASYRKSCTKTAKYPPSSGLFGKFPAVATHKGLGQSMSLLLYANVAT